MHETNNMIKYSLKNVKKINIPPCNQARGYPFIKTKTYIKCSY